MPGRKAFRAGFRRSFWTGLAALLPLILTLFLLGLAWGFINNHVATPINNFFISQLETQTGKEIVKKYYGWNDSVLNDKVALHETLQQHFPSIIGLFIALLLGIAFLCLLGFLLASFFGRRIFGMAEKILLRVPIINSIYPHAKRFTQFVFGDQKHVFNRVVAFQYPMKGVYAMGFVTGEGVRSLNEALGRKMISVFMPTAPTPFAGYVLMLPEEETIPLKISVDEAFSFIISGGVLSPAKVAAGQVADRGLQIAE